MKPIESEARRIIAGFSALDKKLADFKPAVERLRDAFKAMPRDAKILGCTSFKHFCKTHLHRTPRAVFYMLAGGNPVAKRKQAGETVSPIVALYNRLATLFGESGDDMLSLPKVVDAIRRGHLTDEEKTALAALDNIVLHLIPQFIEEYRAIERKRAA